MMKYTRTILLAGIISLTLATTLDGYTNDRSDPIDRRALVTRHNPTLTQIDPLSPLSVGNGRFVFSADVTGLQTFPDLYRDKTPLGTQSEWGWHTIPSEESYSLSDATKEYDFYGRPVPYVSETKGPAGTWLRANPHRLHLGQISLKLLNKIGLQIDDIQDVSQTLDLWTGVLTSRFNILGNAIQITTCCHPEKDLVAVRVQTDSFDALNLAIAVEFPYGSDKWGPQMTDWTHPDRHQTSILHQESGRMDLKRTLDNDGYFVRIGYSNNAKCKNPKPHTYLFQTRKNPLEFVCEFSPTQQSDSLPTFDETKAASINYWKAFWSSGGAVDLSQSTDERANELERRIVLSQYLTAIQCSSDSPPQESGLTHNSWFGKFHLEMHWWHAFHFPLWDRTELLEKSMPWYQKVLPRAQGTAKMQGYSGARWPKMVGPDGRESPSGVGVFLIWQQPHPIYYAELLYRSHPNKETLNEYKDIVFQTAEFMASYAHWNENDNRYVLGPPLIPAQECYPPTKTFNPTFELAYWVYGLECAQEWRRRLGMQPDEKWQRVIDNISKLPERDSVYVTTESTPDTFTNTSLRRDHPSIVAAYGFLPLTKGVNPETMRRTLHKIFEDWNWESTWGWDYPMLAMTAARLGEGELAIQSLLMDTPKNHYMTNGHCYQRPNLPTYLPANGGLLSAVAMMAAGWDGAPDVQAPGFPQDGTWTVRWENLIKYP